MISSNLKGEGQFPISNWPRTSFYFRFVHTSARIVLDQEFIQCNPASADADHDRGSEDAD